MKGMILAAGEGTRLRPLTLHTPKPMLPLGDRPLLEHIIIYLRDHGVDDLAINLYHLPKIVMDYFGDGQRWGVKLRYSVEEHLLGSAGGVKRVADFFDDTFVVYYGDVFTHADLSGLIACHRQAKVVATMGLYRVPDPWNRGIVQLDEAQRMVRFVEKPPRDQVFSDLANAGIYVLEPQVLAEIPPDVVYDFGNDVFPKLLANGTAVAGYALDGFLIDIGLPEKYEEANRMVNSIERK